MKAFAFTVPAPTVTLLAALAGTPLAQAGEPHPLGDHPAVVVQRLHQRAGYDYASKFYPHPAWLYLRAQPPAEAASDVALADGARSTEWAPGDRPQAPALARLSAMPPR